MFDRCAFKLAMRGLSSLVRSNRMSVNDTAGATLLLGAGRVLSRTTSGTVLPLDSVLPLFDSGTLLPLVEACDCPLKLHDAHDVASLPAAADAAALRIPCITEDALHEARMLRQRDIPGEATLPLIDASFKRISHISDGFAT